MANEIQLTAEQIHYINSLPKRTVVFGGKEQTLACDLEKKMAFFLDGIGRPTGRASKLSDSTISAIRHQNSHSTPQGESSAPPDPDIPEPKIVEHESPPDEGARQKKRGGLSNRLRKLAGASDAEISGRDDSDDDGRDVMDAPEEDSEKPKKSKKLWLALIPVVIAVLAVAFAFSPLNSAKSTSGSGTISYGSTTSLSSIDVIQVTRDFIPGDPITEGDIQKATISAEAYNQISLSGATLYQWSRSDSLLNAYAANFIPKGQYLTYENVDSIYHQAVNPWTSSVEDATYITLPLTPELIQSDAVGYGSILDLTITRTTVKTAAAGGEEAENDIPQVPGLEHKVPHTRIDGQRNQS